VSNDTSRAEAEILNRGLSLAMEWGTDWLKPIQARLSATYPQLRRDQLDHYDSVCRAAMTLAHDTVYSMAERAGSKVDSATWRATVLSQYAWVSDDNLARALSQGMYYAWKDGLV
jgi:hypothetical protein